MLTVIGGGKQVGGLNQRQAVEPGLLGIARMRFGNWVRRSVVAKLVRGELAVERHHVLGARGVPLGRELRLAAGLGGAAAPIGGARLAGRGRRARQHPREMLERQRRVFHEAQRDITGQELSVGIGAAVAQRVLLDDLIGEGAVSGGQPAVTTSRFSAGSGGRLPRIVGVREEKLSRGLVLVGVPLPVDGVEDQAVLVGARLRTWATSDMALAARSYSASRATASALLSDGTSGSMRRAASICFVPDQAVEALDVGSPAGCWCRIGPGNRARRPC